MRANLTSFLFLLPMPHRVALDYACQPPSPPPSYCLTVESPLLWSNQNRCAYFFSYLVSRSLSLHWQGVPPGAPFRPTNTRSRKLTKLTSSCRQISLRRAPPLFNSPRCLWEISVVRSAPLLQRNARLKTHGSRWHAKPRRI